MNSKVTVITKKSNLSKYIILSLIAGVLFGWIFPQICNLYSGGEQAYGIILDILKTGASLFLKMIKMILAPLVFATLVVGIAGHGNLKNIGEIGKKTIIYFLAVTSIALIIGLLTANTFQPGKGCNIKAS